MVIKKIYNIVLLIKHQNIDPEIISKTLKLEAYRSWKAGENRFTPKGTALGGLWQDSRWNYVFEFSKNEVLSDELNQILDYLYPHCDFFKQIISEKGSVSLFINVSGKVNHGELFKPSILQKIADMQMSFGFEIFPDWLKD